MCPMLHSFKYKFKNQFWGTLFHVDDMDTKNESELQILSTSVPFAALTVNVCMFSILNQPCVSMSTCLFVSGFGADARKRKPSGVDAVSVSGVCAFGAFGDVGKSSHKCASSAGATRGLLFLEGCCLDILRYPCAFNHGCGLHRICRLSLPPPTLCLFRFQN